MSYAKDASGLLGVGETVKGGLVPAELLVVEWPEVLSPRVHVPRNGGPPPRPEPQPHWSGSKRGPVRKLCAHRGVASSPWGKQAQEKQQGPGRSHSHTGSRLWGLGW